MPTKPTVGVSSVGSQRDRRYTDTFYDQHRSPRFLNGRPWWGEREFAANKPHPDGFCSALNPGDHEKAKLGDFSDQWDAPWLPPMQASVGGGSYFEFNYRKNAITIRYDLIIRDDTEAMNKYYDAGSIVAYQKNWQPPKWGGLPDHTIVAVIGLPPRSPRVAQAAQAGDPWLLGHAKEVNEELAGLLRLTRRGIPMLQPVVTPVSTPEAVLGADAATVKMLLEQVAAMSAKLAAMEQPKAKKPTGKPKTVTTLDPAA